VEDQITGDLDESCGGCVDTWEALFETAAFWGLFCTYWL